MMKSLNQMDLDEWELLPDEGFLEINDDGGKKIYSRKYPKGSTNSVFEMNYFICPPKSTPEFVENTFHPMLPNQLLPLPVDLENSHDDAGRVIKEVKKIPVEIKIIPPPASEKIKSLISNSGMFAAGEQDPISQVFFKKMKEPEFVDMKMDSPKASATPSRGIIPQIEGTGAFQFEEKGDDCKEGEFDSEMGIEKMKLDVDEGEEGGVNVWRWSLTGIGAICSFGVAAATFCIIVFSHQKKKHPQQKNQKLQFQNSSTDKRVKQVIRHASKLNEAMRGVPISRAHITFGGYYDASL